MTSRRRKVALGVVAALLVLAFVALWFAGADAGSPGVVGAPPPSRLYPQTWPPAARGVAWLAAGAAAVAFDLLVVREGAETQQGRDLAGAFAIVTGVAFVVLAAGAFVNAI